MRKYSEEIHPEECLDQIIPIDLSYENIQNFQKNLKFLESFYKEKEKYPIIFESRLFVQRLQTFIFKCHNGKIRSLIMEFVQKYQIGVREPILSKFYENKYFDNSLKKETFQSTQIVEEEKESQESQEQKINQILNDIFDTLEGVPALEKLLIRFPEEFIKIRQLQTFIMGSQTMELSECHSYFVAICAAAQFGCQYLVNRLIKLYFKTGGQAEWLDKKTCPQKMMWVYTLCNIMAYHPWKINQDLLQQMMPWSKQELIHASTIISFYQMLSLICLTFGLVPQSSKISIKQYVKQINIISSPFPSTTKLSQSMMDVIHTQFDFEGRKSGSGRSSSTTMEDTEQQVGFEVMEYMKIIDQKIVQNHTYELLKNKFQNFVDKNCIIQMRDQQSSPSIQESEWNFEQHFHSIIHTFSPQLSKQLGHLLLSSIKVSKQAQLPLTVRKCIKFYANSYMGYVHNGFDYSQHMKKVLNLPLRFYIMISIQYPFLLNKETIQQVNNKQQNISIQTQMSLLLHKTLLLGKTKMETSLAHVTKALSELQFQ